MTPEEFRQMCAAHDLTFNYSDDSNAYRRGRAELDKIHAARCELGDEIAIPIWNEEVNKKLLAPFNLSFHWKKTKEQPE